MNAVILALFLISVLFEVIYFVLFLLTIQLPGFRFWPPPGLRSWQFFTAWILASLVAVNFLFLGLLDFDSALLPDLMERLPYTLLFFIPGAILGTWASMTFGIRNTIGLGVGMVTNGPYRYTRNPQYIGDSLTILGFMILTNSWMVWVIGLLGVGLNLLAPFTEEPWLEERFGEAYKNYKGSVTRFLKW